MRKAALILLLVLIGPAYTYAQELLPTELFQVWKYWNMNTLDYDRNTYEYLQTVDKHWQLKMPPHKDANEFRLLLGYYRDTAWYKDDEYNLFLYYDRNSKSPKSVTYQFSNAETWKLFGRQMELMGADKVYATQSGGGVQTFYGVNDLSITLREYPPGINAAVRIYQVSIMQN